MEENKELISIVVPVYNEGAHIRKSMACVEEICDNAGILFELVLIDDGSKDKTYELVCDLAQKDTRIKGLQFSRNFGKEATIFAGMEYIKGDCCAVIDCDLQHPPETLVEMYHLWEEGYDVIEGIKSNRGKEGIIHKMFVGIFYGIMSSLMKMDMNATSDFKLMDKKVVEVLLSLPEKNTFFRALTFWTGFKSTTVTFDVQERVAGKSKWSFKSLVKYAISNTTSFTTAPLQFVTFMGALMIVFSVVLGAQTLVRYFMGTAVEGFTTVILLLLVIGGCIMISLGIIGMYLMKIYQKLLKIMVEFILVLM